MTDKTDALQQSDDFSGSKDTGEKAKPEKSGGEVPRSEDKKDKMPGANEEKNGKVKDEKKSDSSKEEEEKKDQTKGKGGSGRKIISNNLREHRIEQMMSKAELARKAGLSVLTIDRIEKGYGCRMDTKRKILRALGLKLSDRRKVFKED